MDEKGQFLIMNVNATHDATSEELHKSAETMKSKYKTVEENNEDELETAWDDVSGAELDPKMVKAARQEEIEYVRKMHLYDKVPISECKRATGRMPITVRWIDINKGDQDKPNYRSRVVARETDIHKKG